MRPNTKKKTVVIISLALFIAAAVGLVLPALAKPSNCGGNSAAKSYCRMYGLTIRIVGSDNGGVFELSSLHDSEMKDIAWIANSHWTSGAAFLLKRSRFKPEHDEKHIVAVWNRAYNNIPQPTLWNGYKKTPAHAVTYSDGSAGLISPAAFEQLDLSDFISAKDFVVASVPAPLATDTK